MVIYEHIKGHISIPTYDTGEAGGIFAGMAEKDFTEDDIIKDSCSITSRCCDDSTFTFGSVRPAELSIKLKLDNEIDGKKINKFNVYGAKITLWSCYTDTNERPENTSDKWILRGEFWVTSVSRTKNIYTLRASDALVWFQSDSYEGKNCDNNIYAILTGNPFYLMGAFRVIVDEVNRMLKNVDENGIEIAPPIAEIEYDSNRGDTLCGNLGWMCLRVDENGHKSRTSSDYLKDLGEITAGFARMETDAEHPDTRRLYLLSYGYSPKEETCSSTFKEFWDSITTITYDTIASDGIEYSDWGIFFRAISCEMFTGVNYAVSTGALPYQGNAIIDLSGNSFIEGRLSQAPSWAEGDPYNIVVDSGYLSYMHNLHIRPFTLKCYPVFKTLNEYPKLGQKIRIEAEPNEWRDSIITKMIWKFRGGWEFGCSGQDTRVLSQAAKKSLASHAEQKAKVYASNINKNAMNIARADAETANSNANNRLSHGIFNSFMGYVGECFNVLGLDFGFSYEDPGQGLDK